MTKAAIIIPTWNGSQDTVLCLRALKKETSDYHLIWIDNGSTDEERATVESELYRLDIDHTAILNATNLGFPKAINQGIATALNGCYDPIVMLNNDVVVTDRWLSKLRAHLDANPGVGIIGPVPSKGLPGWQYFRRYVKYVGGDPEKFFNALTPRILVKTQVPFSCAAIRRRVVEQVGYLDEAFSPCLGEDNDYNDRIREAGWLVAYALNSFIYHRHRSSVKRLPNYQEIQRRSEALLAKKRAARAAGAKQ